MSVASQTLTNGEKYFENNANHLFYFFSSNWLDIIKCCILLGFFWYTLAIVFLTGTNRVNIFSIGYLLGSFVFLWQGSDFYLRPINVIIKRWNALISYNIVVILMKSFLQLVGCLFYTDISQKSCSTVQLFGISCIERNGMKFDDIVSNFYFKC